MYMMGVRTAYSLGRWSGSSWWCCTACMCGEEGRGLGWLWVSHQQAGVGLGVRSCVVVGGQSNDLLVCQTLACRGLSVAVTLLVPLARHSWHVHMACMLRCIQCASLERVVGGR